MDNQSTLSPSVGTTIGEYEKAPSVINTELQRAEQAVENLYRKLESVITPVPVSATEQGSGNLVSSRLRLINAALEHILTNIEL